MPISKDEEIARLAARVQALEHECAHMQRENDALRRRLRDIHTGFDAVKSERDWLKDGLESFVNLASELSLDFERLHDGRFTDLEFQALCHGVGTDRCNEFCDGCMLYQLKMFGPEKVQDWYSCCQWWGIIDRWKEKQIAEGHGRSESMEQG
jgi:hypothetical protein